MQIGVCTCRKKPAKTHSEAPTHTALGLKVLAFWMHTRTLTT